MAQIFIFDVAQRFPVHPHAAPRCLAQRLAGERIASLVIPTIWTGKQNTCRNCTNEKATVKCQKDKYKTEAHVASERKHYLGDSPR